MCSVSVLQSPFLQMVPFGPEAAKQAVGVEVSGGADVTSVAPTSSGGSIITAVPYTSNIGPAAHELIVCEVETSGAAGVSVLVGWGIQIQGRVKAARLVQNGGMTELRLRIDSAWVSVSRRGPAFSGLGGQTFQGTFGIPR
jgi:hypothetical protein